MKINEQSMTINDNQFVVYAEADAFHCFSNIMAELRGNTIYYIIY